MKWRATQRDLRGGTEGLRRFRLSSAERPQAEIQSARRRSAQGRPENQPQADATGDRKTDGKQGDRNEGATGAATSARTEQTGEASRSARTERRGRTQIRPSAGKEKGKTQRQITVRRQGTVFSCGKLTDAKRRSSGRANLLFYRSGRGGTETEGGEEKVGNRE